jgi:hypothetical protein
MTASYKVRMLRCAAPFVIAAYYYGTPHSLGLARLACGLFTRPPVILSFYDSSTFNLGVKWR